MGAEHRAYTLVFGGLVQTRTMMQPYASTARFRGGGPILWDGVGAMPASGHRHLGSDRGPVADGAPMPCAA